MAIPDDDFPEGTRLPSKAAGLAITGGRALTADGSHPTHGLPICSAVQTTGRRRATVRIQHATTDSRAMAQKKKSRRVIATRTLLPTPHLRALPRFRVATELRSTSETASPKEENLSTRDCRLWCSSWLPPTRHARAASSAQPSVHLQWRRPSRQVGSHH